MSKKTTIAKTPNTCPELLAELLPENYEIAAEWFAIKNLGYGKKNPQDERELQMAIARVRQNPDEPPGCVDDEAKRWLKDIKGADRYVLVHLKDECPFLFRSPTPELEGDLDEEKARAFLRDLAKRISQGSDRALRLAGVSKDDAERLCEIADALLDGGLAP